MSSSKLHATCSHMGIPSTTKTLSKQNEKYVLITKRDALIAAPTEQHIYIHISIVSHKSGTFDTI